MEWKGAPDHPDRRIATLAGAQHEMAALRQLLTLPRRTGRRPRHGLTVHRVSPPAPGEWTVHYGIPITTPARTVLDLASVLPLRGVGRAVEESERLRLFDLHQIEAAMERHPGGRAMRWYAL